jgi:hypothetical protein
MGPEGETSGGFLLFGQPVVLFRTGEGARQTRKRHSACHALPKHPANQIPHNTYAHETYPRVLAEHTLIFWGRRLRSLLYH